MDFIRYEASIASLSLRTFSAAHAPAEPRAPSRGTGGCPGPGPLRASVGATQSCAETQLTHTSKDGRLSFKKKKKGNLQKLAHWIFKNSELGFQHDGCKEERGEISRNTFYSAESDTARGRGEEGFCNIHLRSIAPAPASACTVATCAEPPLSQTEHQGCLQDALFLKESFGRLVWGGARPCCIQQLPAPHPPLHTVRAGRQKKGVKTDSLDPPRRAE